MYVLLEPIANIQSLYDTNRQISIYDCSSNDPITIAIIAGKLCERIFSMKSLGPPSVVASTNYYCSASKIY